MAAARLDAHLYWSISSRLDEEPTLAQQAAKEPQVPAPESAPDNGKGEAPTFIVGEMTDNSVPPPALGEPNGSIQSACEA